MTVLCTLCTCLAAYYLDLSTSSLLDNKAHPMANTRQAQNLEGFHREMHGIAEQIRIMNKNNARLIQHLTTNNSPPLTAPVLEVGRSRNSHQSGDYESQIRQSTSQSCSTNHRV